MTEAADDDLAARTRALLEPGDIELAGFVVHTDLGRDEEPRVHAATVEVGEVVAEHAGEAGNVWVYSGNDDPRFGTNQHQGLTLDDDAFVWECQQLLREGSFDVVFYYEADVDQAALVDDVAALGYEVTSVEAP